MGNTADMTIIDTLHKKSKQQKLIAKEVDYSHAAG